MNKMIVFGNYYSCNKQVGDNMPEISNAKICHKGINKNYSNLYIRLQIDNFDIVSNNCNEILSKYFKENKIPLEAKKQYEIFIFPDYILENGFSETDHEQLENDLYNKAEGIRTALTNLGINIDTVYLFGNIVSDNPKIVIEIVEHPCERLFQTFVMKDQYIQERLKNYYIKRMLEDHYQKDKMTPKKREKFKLQVKNDYANSPTASLEEVGNFMWAVDYYEDNNSYNIIFKHNNDHVSMYKDSEIRCHCIYPKVFDLSILDKLNEILERSSKIANDRLPISLPIKKANLNTCKYRDLIHIPNFNARMYDDIVLYRETKLFESVDELKDALRIGNTKFNNLKNYFEV